MDYKIDLKEPIPEMIERLKREHISLSKKLNEIEATGRMDPRMALEMLETESPKILKHAVEEEARIMRVIMEKAKLDSAESVRIMQEHRWVSEFLERGLPKLKVASQEQSRSEMDKFIRDIREHFAEEEETVFPLALKALE